MVTLKNVWWGVRVTDVQLQSTSIAVPIIGGVARICLTGRRIVSGVPFVWLCIFFLLPFLIVFKISFATQVLAVPPFTPLLDWGSGYLPSLHIDWSNYHYMFTDDLYIVAYLNSVRIRSEEHTSELQSLMRISYAVFCLKKKKTTTPTIP